MWASSRPSRGLASGPSRPKRLGPGTILAGIHAPQNFGRRRRNARRFYTARPRNSPPRPSPICCASTAGQSTSRQRCGKVLEKSRRPQPRHPGNAVGDRRGGDPLARISHTNRRIGPANQRKLLCRNDLTQIRGESRCRQSVARNRLILEPWKVAV
jgi:hypothetical protein